MISRVLLVLAIVAVLISIGLTYNRVFVRHDFEITDSSAEF